MDDDQQSDGTSGSEDNDLDEDDIRKDITSDKKNDEKPKEIMTPRAPERN